MALATADSGNILVQNFGRNPAVNFNFMLRVEGIYDLPCKSVRAFQRENEYELIQEGGLNDYVHMRRKPISKPFTFQVERYVGVDILDPLANGTDLVLPVILLINRYSVYGDFLPVRMYVFTGCTVMSKEYGELNAERSGLLVETTTIAYREMVCMENVAGSFIMEEPWKFHGTEKKGNGNQSAVHYKAGDVDDREPALEAARERAEKWQFQDENKKPNITPLKAVQPKNQKSKTEMEKAAQEWMFKDKSGKPNNKPMRSVQPAGQKKKEDMEKAAKEWQFKDQNGEGNSTPLMSVQPLGQKTQSQMEAAAWEWQFKDPSGKGNTTPMAAKPPKGQKTKAEMEEAAKEWQFKSESGEGNTTPLMAVQPEGQKSKSEMESESREWSFSDGEGKGNTTPTSAVQPEGQKSKSEMESNAKKWPPTRSAANIASFLKKNS